VKKGLVATANQGPDQNCSTFFLTLGDEEIKSFLKKHTIFGEVVEGLDVVDKFNSVYVDQATNMPL